MRVIAPSRSRAMVNVHNHTAIIERRFAALGLRLSYGEHVDERDAFDSSPARSRVADLHAAFADPAVAAIMTVIGGYDSNEPLPCLDWDLIRANTKIFCGAEPAATSSPSAPDRAPPDRAPQARGRGLRAEDAHPAGCRPHCGGGDHVLHVVEVVEPRAARMLT